MTDDRSTTVRAERLDARATGGWRPDVEARMETLDRPIRRLLEPALDRLREADEIVVVPDAHYPFHPSTGVVTDPAVVGSVLAHLGRETAATLSVAGTSDERTAFDRTATYLGYPAALERSGASLLDLAAETNVRVREPVSAGESEPNEVAITVPEPLLEATVVVVPSLRPTREGTVAGAMRTLGRHGEPIGADSAPDRTESTPERATWAIAEATDPILAVLDATTVFAGEPYAADTLLAGDPAVVDAVGTDLLGRSVADDGALSLALGDGTTSIRVDGVDPEALKAELPTGDLPPTGETHPAVSAAYGLYARVAGDAVPPQLEVER